MSHTHLIESIPIIGFGTYQISRTNIPNILTNIIKHVIINHHLPLNIDTAALYRNECAIGTTLKSLETNPEFNLKRE